MVYENQFSPVGVRLFKGRKFSRLRPERFFLGACIGDEYEQDEVVWLHLNGDRRPARIARFGLARTSFYCCDVLEKDGKQIITGGTLLTVPNSEVKGLRIERPLDKLDLLPPER